MFTFIFSAYLIVSFICTIILLAALAIAGQTNDQCRPIAKTSSRTSGVQQEFSYSLQMSNDNYLSCSLDLAA